MMPNSSRSAATGGYWYVRVAPYMKNTQILLCPSRSPHVSTTPPAPADLYTADYAPNYYINHVVTFNSLGAVPQPSQTAMIADNIGADYDYFPWWTAATFHNGGGNVGFFDGHAKWYGLQTGWTQYGLTP